MHKTEKAGFAGLLCVACTASSAAGYVGAAVGQTRASLDCAGTVTCDKTDTGYKLNLGALLSPNLALEVAYLGQVSLAVLLGPARITANLDGSAFGAYAVGIAPLSDVLRLFGKLGVTPFETDGRTALGGLSSSDDESETAPAHGPGGVFSLGPDVALRAAWERMGATYNGEKADVDFVSTGVSRLF